MRPRHNIRRRRRYDMLCVFGGLVPGRAGSIELRARRCRILCERDGRERDDAVPRDAAPREAPRDACREDAARDDAFRDDALRELPRLPVRRLCHNKLDMKQIVGELRTSNMMAYASAIGVETRRQGPGRHRLNDRVQ